MTTKATAIRVEHISKRYRLGAEEEEHESLGAMLVDTLKSPIKNFRKYRSLYNFEDENAENILWALRNVSFEVKEGEVLGIIGGNGAGKSTLLKVLSRITEPTSGRIEIHGRVGSLLEVGTGFNPDLSGRDNVYMNGVILGMRKHEVDRRFDEIVEFSGMSKFIDTPIKRYSSGMKVRLAFAVAAHLEPEILIIDEVLAVGDDEFQRKCLGKMGDVSRSGRTIFFVSHSMAAVSTLCTRAIWMKQGQVQMDGVPTEVIGAYLSSSAHSEVGRALFTDADQTGPMRLETIRVFVGHDEYTPAVQYDQGAKIAVRYRLLENIDKLSINLQLTDSLGNMLFSSTESDDGTIAHEARAAGLYESILELPPRFLRPGRYFVSVNAFNYWQGFVSRPNVLAFDVSTVNFTLNAKRPGVIMPVLPWTLLKVGS